MTRKRSLTGIRTTGSVHLGNYLGTMKPAIALQGEFDCLYFLADMHSFTTRKDPVAQRVQTYDVMAAWLAIGFDHKTNIIYRQSDLPLVTELAWYLSCCTGMGFLEKAHAYKDAAANGKEVNHGVFAYPVLMAADILLYDADVVPVAKDQKQHVEMARDMAGSFNALYGESVLHLPEVRVEESVMTIPGLDGRKMSKSYDNTIPLFCTEKELRKLIMSIKTDSTPLEEPKVLDGTLVAQLYNYFATPSQYADLKARLAAGGLGWGHAKEELFQVINQQVAEPRKRYAEIRPDESLLDTILDDGRDRAYAIARPVLNRVRRAIGLREQ